MFTQEEIEDLKRLPVYNRVGGVVHRVKEADTDDVHFIELPDLSSEGCDVTRTRCKHVIIDSQGYLQYEVDVDQHVTGQVHNEDMAIDEDWEGDITYTNWGIVYLPDAKGVIMYWVDELQVFNVELVGIDIAPFHFRTREEAEVLRDELVEEWESLKGIRI